MPDQQTWSDLIAKLAHAFSSGSESLPPAIAQGVAIARQEQPDLAPIETFGPVSRALMSRALGYLSPGGTIYLNAPALEGQSPQDVADTVLHENVHAGQYRERGTLQALLNTLLPQEPYHRRSDEMAAYAMERKRRQRMGRQEVPVPSFLTGEYITPEDILLPLLQRGQRP